MSSVKNLTSERLFLVGTFLSQLGTMTLVLTALKVMGVAQAGTLVMGYYVGGTRLAASLSAQYLPLPVSLRERPIRLLFASEAIATVLTVLMAASLAAGLGWWAFIACAIVRAIVVGPQIGVRSLIAKTFAGKPEASNVRWALYLNKASQGSIVLAAPLSLALPSQSLVGLYVALGLDAATYAINALVALRLSRDARLAGTPAAQSTTERFATSGSAIANLRRIWEVAPQTLVWDLIFLVTFFATNLTYIRILGTRSDLLPGVVLAAGLAIFAASPIVTRLARPTAIVVSTLMLASGWLLLLIPSWPVVSMSFLFLARVGYWGLHHRSLGELMHALSTEEIAKVSNTRGFVFAILVGASEILGGYVLPLVPLEFDFLLRGGVALLALFPLLHWFSKSRAATSPSPRATS
jgi:hypothetical protein